MFCKEFLILSFILLEIEHLYSQNISDHFYEKFYNNYEILDKYTEQIDIEEYSKRKTNINNLKLEDLIKMPYIDSLLAVKIILYKKNNGDILSLYELQNIEGLNDEIIVRIAEYLRFEEDDSKFNIKNVLTNVNEAKQLLQIKTKYLIDKPKGYATEDGYISSPLYHNVKYRCQFYNNLSIGFNIEKDYGERYLYSNKMPDFYNYHIGINNISVFDKIIIGDYKIISGEGLTISNDFPLFRQYNIFNQFGFEIKPSTSNDEANFFRGVSLNKAFNNKYSLSLFYSNKNIDGDTAINEEDPLYKLSNTNGLHNTLNLESKRHIIKEYITGGNISLSGNNYNTGITMYVLDYNKQIVYDSSIRNINRQIETPYYYSGYYYKLKYKNLLHYTEMTFYNKFKDIAVMSGVNIAIGKYNTLGIIYRNYKQNYVNMYNTAYERGVNMSFFSRVYRNVYFDFSYDIYRSNWLKYLIATPSYSKENYIKLSYYPTRYSEYYISYNFNQKFKNYITDTLKSNATKIQRKNNFRLNTKNDIGPYTIKNRVEFCNINFNDAKHGFLLNTSLTYRTNQHRMAFYLGFCFFSTDSYDERIYAYENDLLYEFSVIPYYYRGDRMYVMTKYKLSKHLSFYIKCSQTRYYDRSSISSGLSEIDGNKKREVKLQLIIQ